MERKASACLENMVFGISSLYSRLNHSQKGHFKANCSRCCSAFSQYCNCVPFIGRRFRSLCMVHISFQYCFSSLSFFVIIRYVVTICFDTSVGMLSCCLILSAADHLFERTGKTVSSLFHQLPWLFSLIKLFL